MTAPSIQRVNAVLLFSILAVAILYYAKAVLIPVTSAILLAMLMTPLSNRLEAKGMKRVYTSLLSVFIVICVISFVVFLVVWQGNRMSRDIPKIEAKMKEVFTRSQDYVEKKWNISSEQQLTAAKEQGKKIIQNSGKFLKNLFGGILSILASVVLITIFLFLLLYQREKYEVFILKLYKGDSPDQALHVLRKTARIAQYYLVGRLISVAVLTFFYTAGLMIVGVRNAFLLSFIAALLTLVPYVGTIAGSMFPVLMALVTADTLDTALWALGVVVFVQAADNYFFEPYLVGGEVNISAFFTILIVTIGGFIWGVAGMVLFIPLLGIARIVFDNVKELEAFGFLVGDQQEGRQSERLLNTFKKLFGKRKSK